MPLDGGEQIADHGRRRHFVGEPGQKRHLFAAVGGAAARHVGAFVPAEDAGAGAENGGVFYAAEEFRVGVMRVHDAMTPTYKPNASEG